MSNLNPELRVDKRGIAVTRHVKIDSAPASSRKPIAAPTLTQKDIDKLRPLRKVKPRKLTAISAKDVLVAALRFPDRKLPEIVPVPMSDQEIYDYMQLGLKAREAVALKMSGFAAHEYSTVPQQGENEPEGSYVSRVRQVEAEARNVQRRQSRYADVSHRLLLKDIPAEVTSKCLENGVSMEHFDRFLTDEQVVGLFTKTTNTKNNDVAIHSLLTGQYSYEHYEKFGIRSINKWRTSLPETQTMDVAVIAKAIDKAKSVMPKISGAPDETQMIKLAAAHGERVLDLHLPELMWHGFRTSANGGSYDYEDAKYLDDFIHSVRSQGIHDLEESNTYVSGLSEKYPRSGDTEATESRDSIYSFERILRLRDAGLEPQEIINSLQNRWRDDQAIAVYQQNVPGSLVDGLL
jgi:hypothetical protein